MNTDSIEIAVVGNDGVALFETLLTSRGWR